MIASSKVRQNGLHHALQVANASQYSIEDGYFDGFNSWDVCSCSRLVVWHRLGLEWWKQMPLSGEDREAGQVSGIGVQQVEVLGGLA